MLNKLFLTVVTIFTLVAVVACTQATPLPEEEAIETGSAAEVETPWLDFTSPEGQFTVSLPDYPDEGTQFLSGESAESMVHTYKSVSDSATYVVAYRDLDKADMNQAQIAEEAAKVFDVVFKGIARQFDSTLADTYDKVKLLTAERLVAGETVSMAGHQGWQTAFTIPASPVAAGAQGQVQTFVAGNRLYQLVVVEGEQTSFADSTPFLSSFSVQDASIEVAESK
ncbi:MAG: hypothetical protein KDJ52_31710 [Anaerolineae bacterium]|nr:hypothetical protein [Anaerolineae bacterium]